MSASVMPDRRPACQLLGCRVTGCWAAALPFLRSSRWYLGPCRDTRTEVITFRLVRQTPPIDAGAYVSWESRLVEGLGWAFSMGAEK